MFKYVLKRVFLLIPTLLIVLTAVFCLARMVPGSPVYSLREDEDYTTEMVEDLKQSGDLKEKDYQKMRQMVDGYMVKLSDYHH